MASRLEVVNTKKLLLLIDGIVNLLLGILLLLFPTNLVNMFGLPEAKPPFYPNLFGAVLIGIGVALFIELIGEKKKVRGLGLGGAIVINSCGAIVLAIWLLWDKLELTLSGQIFLWSIVVIVLSIGLVELFSGSWKEG